jgi:photosynthetic reaction center H subunit
MHAGAITQHIDVAQVVLYVFWVFFAGLVFYLRQEDRREGYPLENAKTGQVGANYWPVIPDQKAFLLPHGHGEVRAPNGQRDTRQLNAVPAGNFPGAPLVPTGNPLLAGVGPGSWAERADVPDLTMHGEAKIVPMAKAHGYVVAPGDPNPIGLPVRAYDGKIGGTISEIWVDQSEHMIRYLQVHVADGQRDVLLPITFCLVRAGADEPHVYVNAITSTQFADVPLTKSPDQITLLEEEKVTAYYGAGQLYATKKRADPILDPFI